MRIAAVETLYLPSRPNVVWVQVETDDGTVGLGETFYGASAIAAHIHDASAPLLLGCDPMRRTEINRRLRPYVGAASAGAEMRAASAIDIALWDIAGKTSGMSLVQLLGGAVRETVPAYNTCAGNAYVQASQRVDSSNWGVGQEQEVDPYDDLNAFLHTPAELARSLVDQGFVGMKVWPFDLAAVRSNGQDPSPQELAAGVHVLEEIRRAAGD